MKSARFGIDQFISTIREVDTARASSFSLGHHGDQEFLRSIAQQCQHGHLPGQHLNIVQDTFTADNISQA